MRQNRIQHEINNKLGPFKNLAQMIKRADADDDFDKFRALMVSEADRVLDRIEWFKNLSQELAPSESLLKRIGRILDSLDGEMGNAPEQAARALKNLQRIV